MSRPKVSNAYRADLNNNARDLRRKLTPAENELWLRIRNDQLAGLRFRRQHRIEFFIVDFYCPAVRVAVEIDGPSHDETMAEDAERDARLAALCIRVIRFANQAVARDIDAVVLEVAKFCGIPV